MAKSPSEVIIGELTRIRSTLERLEQQESASKDAFNALYSEMEDYKKRAIFDLEKHILNDLVDLLRQSCVERAKLHGSRELSKYLR